MSTEIEIDGLDEIQRKIAQLPPELHKAMGNAMDKSLMTLWENVPPYPAQVVPPEVYRRTGDLGGSIGSSPAGGKSGAKPTVYGVTQSLAGRQYEGKFGTNLSYAKYVIDPKRQAYMHRPGYKGRAGWWTMDTIKKNAEGKIKRLWQTTISLIKSKLGL